MANECCSKSEIIAALKFEMLTVAIGALATQRGGAVPTLSEKNQRMQSPLKTSTKTIRTQVGDTGVTCN